MGCYFEAIPREGKAERRYRRAMGNAMENIVSVSNVANGNESGKRKYTPRRSIMEGFVGARRRAAPLTRRRRPPNGFGTPFADD